MPVKIRLKRIGSKNHPAYRVVVADNRSPRDGKFIEEIGSYDPRKPGVNFSIKAERAEYWLKQGAQPSDTVASMLRKSKRIAAAPAA